MMQKFGGDAMDDIDESDDEGTAVLFCD